MLLSRTVCMQSGTRSGSAAKKAPARKASDKRAAAKAGSKAGSKAGKSSGKAVGKAAGKKVKAVCDSWEDQRPFAAAIAHSAAAALLHATCLLQPASWRALSAPLLPHLTSRRCPCHQLALQKTGGAMQESYRRYVHGVLQQVHPELNISAKAMEVRSVSRCCRQAVRLVSADAAAAGVRGVLSAAG